MEDALNACLETLIPNKDKILLLIIKEPGRTRQWSQTHNPADSIQHLSVEYYKMKAPSAPQHKTALFIIGAVILE